MLPGCNMCSSPVRRSITNAERDVLVIAGRKVLDHLPVPHMRLQAFRCQGDVRNRFPVSSSSKSGRGSGV